MGTITIPMGTKRYADGTYKLKMTGVSQGITTTREIDNLIIDAAKPIVNISAFKDDNNLEVGFEVVDTNLKTATMTLKLKDSTDIIETVDVIGKTQVIFTTVEVGKIYVVTLAAEDNYGNKHEWIGMREIMGSLPSVEIKQIYNMSHDRFTGEFKYGNKQSGNLTITSEFFNTNDTAIPNSFRTLNAVLTPTAYAENQYNTFAYKQFGLLPDTDYVLKITAENADKKKRTESKTFRTGKTPEFITSKDLLMSTHNQYNAGYEFKNIAAVTGEEITLFASLIDTVTNTQVGLELMETLTGPIRFANLVPGRLYKIKAQASTSLFEEAFKFPDIEFTTLLAPTLTTENDTDTLQKTANTIRYRFQNVAEGAIYSAELRTSSNGAILQTRSLSDIGSVTFSSLTANTAYSIVYTISGPAYAPPIEFTRSFTTLADNNAAAFWSNTENVVFRRSGDLYMITFGTDSAFTNGTNPVDTGMQIYGRGTPGNITFNPADYHDFPFSTDENLNGWVKTDPWTNQTDLQNAISAIVTAGGGTFNTDYKTWT